MIEKQNHFISAIIAKDLSVGKHKQIVMRFPPEPNGYLHLGHAKSICLNFGLAKQYDGKVNLRFDDTNPTTEDAEFVASIKKDIRWLGFDWDRELYTSDYFEQLYTWARLLVRKGLAYVDDSRSEEIAALKGDPNTPGTPSPYRDRPVADNLTLLEEMKVGRHAEGTKTLRAKIDMAHPNMLMRDPVLYRIKHAHHHRTKDQWCIYPMYDFAHGQSDALEQISHSLCTLEFAPHRDVYDWLIEKLGIYPSKQYEFARLSVSHTVMSKRKLRHLVQQHHVDGWDDPRMPTLSGMRRRGYPPESIHRFCDKIGVAKRDNLMDIGLLEFCVRECLEKRAQRRMVVLDPIKIVLTNYSEEQEESIVADSIPHNPEAGSRELTFGKNIYIEKADFMENPIKGYFRLSPGSLVRLKSAYIIRCDEVIHNDSGTISELRCTYIPESKSGADTSGLKVKGVIHWVSAKQALAIEVRLYDRLFTRPDMDNVDDYTTDLNTSSLTRISTAYAESALSDADPNAYYQFLRTGYFRLDSDSTPKKMVFNRTVTLRDTWIKKTNR